MKVKKESVDFVESARFNIQLLHLFGVWVTPNSSNFYKLYAFFMQILIGYTYMLNVCLLLPSEHDLETFMASMPVSLTMIGFCIKLANLYLQRFKIQQFFDLLNSPKSQVSECEELKLVRNANRNAKKIIFTWFGIFLMAGIMAVSPVASRDPKVPYPIYYPDWRESATKFHASCIYQVFCVFCATIANGAVDAFMSYFLTVFSGMLEALGWKLENMRRESMNSETVKREFLKCIQRHKHLLRISSELQNVFSTVTFVQIFLSGFIVCGLLFQLSILSPLQNPKIFFKLLSFSSAIFIQIFLPCYTANEVRIKSEQLKLKLYSSDWLDLPIKTKKMMVIFMQRVQRPILITVGGILFLGMENFMAVVRSSYSLYSLLRRVHAE